MRHRFCSRGLQWAVAHALVGAGTAGVSLAQVYTLVSPNADIAILAFFGVGLTPVIDVNGDGVPDIVVGAESDQVPGSGTPSGRAYVFSGADRSLLLTLIQPVQTPHPTGFGASVAGLYDVDGDGRGDIAVAAPTQAAPPGGNISGRVHIYSGATGAWLREIVDHGTAFQCGLVHQIYPLGDLDGDGSPEVGVMASYLGCSRLRVYSGADAGLLFEAATPAPRNAVAFRDVDADGVTDLLLGVTELRRVFVVSGATGAVLMEIAHPFGEAHVGSFGGWVAAVEDLTGDGVRDILVSGFEHFPGHPHSSGTAYLFSGADGGFVRFILPAAPRYGAAFGSQILALPDVDGDGREDVLITAFRDSPPGLPQQCGSAFIYSGATSQLLRTLYSPNAQYFGGFGFRAARLLEERPNRRASFAISAPDEWNARGRVYIFAACRADADADGVVSSQDLSRFIAGWLTTVGSPPGTLPPPGVHHGDFNGDGAVNSTDIAAFVGAWLVAVQEGGCP